MRTVAGAAEPPGPHGRRGAAAGPEYESRTFRELTVTRPGDPDETFRDVRVQLLPSGALRVYRSRTFSDAAPVERMFPHGRWVGYSGCPVR